MQATLQLSPPSLVSLLTPTTTKSLVLPFRSTIPRAQRCLQLKATNVTSDPSTVDYSSSATSVFPAEACETIGGEACDVEMYPEVKLEPQGKSAEATPGKELEDRDYLEYDGPKTVFPAEACDDLGGEFCEPDYQKGVY
ncbi:light-regulated protein 1, chloroplastic [Argentina anserina]|uniref:light-regulated protein 1, chloroplastic n=1 Tax=Argentina anserina TaxID=57926 RepID=UPI0021765181|nr:light-regulated protein 1, chloroplastic [Potentilla anserina]